MQSENLGIVQSRNDINVLSVFDDFIVRISRDFIFEAFFWGGSRTFKDNIKESMLIPEDSFFDIIVSVGVEKFTV